MQKRIGKILLGVLVFLVLLIGACYIALQYPAVQTFLARQVTAMLSRSLKTKVSIDRVEISFFNKAELMNFYMEDHRGDTAISAKDLSVRFNLISLLDKKINISSIGLTGARVKLRMDSLDKLNLAELFASGQPNNVKPDTAKKKPFAWNIDLDRVDLYGTEVQYYHPGDLLLNVKVGELAVMMKKLDLKKGIISIASIKTDSADVQLSFLKKGAKKDSIAREAFHLPGAGMSISFGNFDMAHSRFRLNTSDTAAGGPGIDYAHLDVMDISLQAQNGKLEGDTIINSIKSFHAREKSGFTIENITADAHVSPQGIILEHLNLKTPESEINDRLSFRYTSFDSLPFFATAVRIKADFENSKLALSDLKYFVKNMGPVTRDKIYISGEIDGRLNNLKGRGIEVRAGKNTLFKGDFYAKGGPDIDKMNFVLDINRLATTADELRRLIPGVDIPKNLDNLGLIYYTGSVKGLINDFISNGKLVTSIGSADVNADFKYDRDHNKAYYQGDLALNEFDLGKYLGIEDYLGKISMHAKVNGGGLTPESLNLNIDGSITSMVAKGYDYRDILVQGSVLKKSFSGKLEVNDKNLQMSFNGTADLSGKIPAFDLEAAVTRAHLKNLNLLKDNIAVSGNMKLNFRGVKIDDFMGAIEISNVTVSRDSSINQTIKSAKLEAKLLSSQKKEITLESDLAEAELTGNFSIKELPKSLLNFARYTFLKQEVDTSELSPQDFSLDLRLYDPGNLPQIIMPKLVEVSSSRVQCDYNSVDHKLNLTARVPEIQYGDLRFKQLDVKAATEKGDINFNASLDKIYNNITDEVMLDSMAFNTITQGNNLRFDMQAYDGNHANYAILTAYANRNKGKAVLSIDPGDIKLGANKWHFDAGDSIYIDGNKITTRNLVFRSDLQTLYINSYLKGDTATSLKLTMENTSIADFMRTFAPQSKDITGTINGKLMVDDIFSTPDVYGNLKIDSFKLGDELIGNINVDSRLDSAAKRVELYSSIKSDVTNLEARGYISMDPANPGMKIDLDAPVFNLNFLNYKFFDKYVKNVHGTGSLKASLYGSLKKPLLGGNVTLINDTVTVSYLNTTYIIRRQQATLDEHGIDIGNIKIYDIKGTEGYGSGRINHESFRNFALDLRVTTQNPDNPAINNSFQFLNTTEKQAPSFYGVAFGTGNVSFVGDINSPVIKAYATTGKGTWCKLPSTTSYETGQYGFFKFTEHGRDSLMTARKRQGQFKLNGVTFLLDLDVTPDARMDIIFNPTTNDIMTGYGTGHLRIQIPKNGSLGMYGTYALQRGTYGFTLEGVINKKFTMDEGGTMVFNGEIYKARLDLSAVYETRTSVYELIQEMVGTLSATNTQAAAAQQRIPVDLLMNLKGYLERPDITFNIKVIDPDPSIKSYVDQKMVVLQNSEAELNKQVFGLLVMNRFIPISTTTGGAITNSNYASETATNTVSQFISGQLSNYIGNLLQFANVQNLDVNIGYQQYGGNGVTAPTGSLTTQPLSGNEVQLALSQRLLNNRLSINAGSSIDYGSTSATSQNKSIIPTGDVQIEYALTPNGAWRAKVFNRDNYDYYELRNTNKTGIGVTYRQEFDKASDLNKRKKKQRQQQGAVPPVPARDSLYRPLAPIPTEKE